MSTNEKKAEVGDQSGKAVVLLVDD